MKYKVIKDYVDIDGKLVSARDELIILKIGDFTDGLLDNGFIEEIEDGDDYFRLSQGNAFHTEEEAEEYLEYLKAKAVLRADTEGHRFLKDKRNFTVYRNNYRELATNYTYSMPELGQFYFATEQDAQNSIDTHAKEWHLVFDYELKNGA